MKHLVLFLAVICCSYHVSAQNEKSKVYKVWVIKVNRDVHKGYLTQLKDSSVVIFEISGDPKQEILISTIDQIKFRKKGKMGRSIAIGAVGGLVVGGVTGYATGEGNWIGREGQAVGLGVLGLPLGAAIGAAIGTGKTKYMIEGSQENYERYRANMSNYLNN
jgi:hypothetical protein